MVERIPEAERPVLLKRGPKTPLSDEELLVEIRDDLEASPFQGKGHRKVRARLKVLKGIRVSNKRVLRLMRENRLLSPYRGRIGQPLEHDGTIVTDAPNVMWGTDGTRILTLDEGWVWLFAAVEHWNAECVGIHASKSGDRFEAMEPVKQGLKKHYGALTAKIAAGLALRCDHGSQYTSDHFQKELKYFGIRQSLAYVGEPQTNGVIERFWKTLKKQVLEGRIYQTLADLRMALRDFVDLYNHRWRLEKLGGHTPDEMRQAWLSRQAA